MYYCCVRGCTSNAKTHGVSLYRFPSVNKLMCVEYQTLLLKRRTAWFQVLNLKKNVSVDPLSTKCSYRVCSKHFKNGKPSDFRDVENDDWVPSVNIGSEKCNVQLDVSPKSHMKQHFGVRHRLKKRKLRFEDEDEVEVVIETETPTLAPNELPEENINDDIETSALHLTEENCTNCSEFTQTDTSSDYISHLEEKVSILEEQIAHLQQKVEDLSFTENCFKENDSKLKYYTGVPSFQVFLLMLHYLKDGLADITTKDVGLTPFQILLLMLTKLRLNESFVGLGYKFGITHQLAGKIFRKAVVIFEHTFSSVILWPERNVIIRNTPISFKRTYGSKITVIIDCFEIEMEKPSTVKAQAEVFSPYKYYHTIKYLIGVTSYGLISYISSGWGGRTSDTEIVQRSDFLSKLQRGDVVMADRGFGVKVKQLIKSREARLLTPAFTRGKKQLHPKDIEKTRRLASNRIHVERVIGQLRNKFAILRGPVQISFLRYEYDGENFFDFVVRCCCIISNICDGIVTK